MTPKGATPAASPQERWGCACPRLDGADCIEFRSRPSWADPEENYTEEGERCECHCHDMDSEDEDFDP